MMIDDVIIEIEMNVKRVLVVFGSSHVSWVLFHDTCLPQLTLFSVFIFWKLFAFFGFLFGPTLQ